MTLVSVFHVTLVQTWISVPRRLRSGVKDDPVGHSQYPTIADGFPINRNGTKWCQDCGVVMIANDGRWKKVT